MMISEHIDADNAGMRDLRHALPSWRFDRSRHRRWGVGMVDVSKSVTEQASSAATGAHGVRTCPVCGRPVAALDMKEYTTARARLVISNGLCVCPVAGLPLT